MIIDVAGGNNGVGFAIPTQIARNISLQLAEFGSTKPGIVGIVSQNITPDLINALKAPVSKGVVVSQIVPQSAASKAHILPKDIITKINNDNVHSSSQLKAAIYTQRAGSNLDITLYRDGKQKNIIATTQATAEIIETKAHQPAQLY